MEYPKPVNPQDRPCASGCPLHGETVTFGEERASQINNELRLEAARLKDGQDLPSDPSVRAEVLRCARFRARQMCTIALDLIARTGTGKESPAGRRRLDSARISSDNPYL